MCQYCYFETGRTCKACKEHRWGYILVERKGLLIEYEYCTGCYSCEVACKQEHNFSPGACGIKINEIITEKDGKMRIDYVPVVTPLCNLCAALTAAGEKPACVKHCQSAIMWYGTIKELAGLQENKPRSVLFAPI